MKGVLMGKNQTNMKKNLTYRTIDGKDLLLSFLPPLQEKYKKAPVYFLIPGGGWHSANRQSMIDFSKKSVAALREDGFAVVAVEYRPVGEKYKICDVIEDCFDALGYLAEHSEDLQIDTRRIITSGHSAGAHLALMLAYADGNLFTQRYDFRKIPVKIRAVAALSPATVLHEDGYPETISFGTDHLFSDPEDLSERKKASPIEYVNSDCPPTVLFAGTADPVIYCESSKILYKKLIAADAKAELVLSENAGHVFEKLSEKEPSISLDDIQTILTDFVREQMK